MAVSKEMRLLLKRWGSGQGWPLRLESLEIRGLRGWTGQRIDFEFPIVALVGENGAGKSTVLQAAASVYQPPGKAKKGRFASYYFPETAWEKIPSARIDWRVKEGTATRDGSVRKFEQRWRGNPERRERHVENIDLSRIQPVSARVGFMKLAKAHAKEGTATIFQEEALTALSAIMGRSYEVASMSTADIDTTRPVPVLSHSGKKYSGFHGGAGETTMVEFLKTDVPKNSLVLIDEIETSLHPRAQRRLMRRLADVCRHKEIQIIVSTHSPYILDELPEEARLYIWEGASGREIMKGVSPQFAMTKMDLEQHPDFDVYVEDDEAKTMLREILIEQSHGLVQRCLIVPYGAASVGMSLGQMVQGKKFPRPTCVFLDGDQSGAPGCMLLPGGDAPERVVFEALKENNWQDVAVRVGRTHSAVADACNKAMTADDHHEWIRHAADDLTLSGDMLWQALCSVWAGKFLKASDGKAIADHILSLEV